MYQLLGVVRGCRVHNLASGIGGVIVEVAPGAELPPAPCLMERGRGTREADGLAIGRAVEVIGDWRLCQDLAEALIDQPVIVTIEAQGRVYAISPAPAEVGP